MTIAHSETGQMAVCCQNLMLGALSSCSALSVLVGVLFKKFGLFLNMSRTLIIIIIFISFPFIIYRCSTIDLEVVIKYSITLVTLLVNSFVHFYYIY